MESIMGIKFVNIIKTDKKVQSVILKKQDQKMKNMLPLV